MKAKVFKSKLLVGLVLLVALPGLIACGQENVGTSSGGPEIGPPTPEAWVMGEEPKELLPAASDVTEPETNIKGMVTDFFARLPDGYYAIGKIDALKDLINTGAILVDVREASDYAAGHIPGAINIPIRELTANLDNLPTEEPLVVYCASGHRAAMSLAALQLLGYDNTRSFPGSYKAWTEATEEVSKEIVEPKTFPKPDLNEEMLARVDEFLNNIPENYYAVSKIDMLKEILNTEPYGALIVDLREADEYGEGHIPGAINVPVREVTENLDQIPMDRPVIMSCASGHRASLATAAMHILGYNNVRSFPPSFKGWSAANEQIEK
jgi:rhodanese-related sulfurtransferase